MRLVATLSVAAHRRHPPQVHRPPTASMTRMAAHFLVANHRYEHHHGPHQAAMPHHAPPLQRPLRHFWKMKSKKYSRQSMNRKRRQSLVRVIKKFDNWLRRNLCYWQTSNGLNFANGLKTTLFQQVAAFEQPSRFMMTLRLSDVLCPFSYLLCNEYLLCVFVCHGPLNNATTHLRPLLWDSNASPAALGRIPPLVSSSCGHEAKARQGFSRRVVLIACGK